MSLKMLVAINNDTTNSSSMDEEGNNQSNSTTFLESLLELFSKIENMLHEFGNSASEMALGADHGGSSKYSNENFED